MIQLSLALLLATQSPVAEASTPVETKTFEPAVRLGQDLFGWKIRMLGPPLTDEGEPATRGCDYHHEAEVVRDTAIRFARIEVHCASDSGDEPAPPLLIIGDLIGVVDSVEEPEPEVPVAKEDEASGTEERAQEEEEPRAHGEAAAEPEASHDEAQPFLKGELTNFGTVQLLTHENAAAVALGVSQIDEKFFLRVQPELHFDTGKFSVGFGAPLRFEVIDLGGVVEGNVFRGAGNFRTEDWDQIEDFLRPLRYLTWGRKEDNLYVDLNRIHALTLGHGQLMRRYSPTIDIDEDNLFAEVDAYSDFGGVELVAGPFPIPRIMGGLVFFKPLGFLKDNLYAHSWSLGFSYLTDLNVPADTLKIPSPADGRPQIPVLGDNELLFEGHEALTNHRVQGLSLDSEVKVYKDDNHDVKVYADWSTLIFPGVEEAGLEAFQSHGFTLGSIWRMSFGSKEMEAEHSERHKKRADARHHASEDGHDLHHVSRGDEEEIHRVPEHALRARVELRTFDAGFLPSYFDSFYEADKFQFELGGTPDLERAALRTKWRYLHDLQKDEAQRVGGYLELSYLMPGWFGATVSYEDAFALDLFQAKAARNFALHLETNHTEWLKAFVTYHYRHFDDFSKLFQFNTDNQVLYLGAKAKVLPFLFIHVGTQRAFRVGFSEDDSEFQEFEIDESEEPVRLTSVGLENEWATDILVELGWEF